MDSSKSPKPHNTGILERKILYSRLALIIENIWPALWPPAGMIGIFVLISLTGIWPVLPVWAHKLVLALFGLLFIVSLFPLLMGRWPTRQDALRRLEKTSGLKHHPISSYEDSLGIRNPSRATQQLWQAHRDRISTTFSRLKSGFPRPRVDRYDPFALRVLISILVVTGLLATGNLVSERLTSAFKLGETVQHSSIRLDAWITPPPYTGKAPVILSDGSRPMTSTDEEKRFIKVPENSSLIIRISNSSSRNYEVLQSDQITYGFADKETYSLLQPVEQEKGETGENEGIRQYRVSLAKSISIKIRNGLHDLHSWQIYIEKDLPPRIRLIQPVRETARNAVHLSYIVSDDYGITSAKARFLRPGDTADKKNTVRRDPDAPLGEAPEFALQIPRNSAQGGRGETFWDLTAHPWAGLETMLTLTARDEAGQEAHTEPLRIILPSRQFSKPLARALIEQRRSLVMKPVTNREPVLRALNALSISPETFINDIKIYLGLRTAFFRLVHNEDRESVESVVDQLWELALYIEDGELSEAERQMKLAQDKLAKALRDGASGKELRQHLDDFREALAKFVEELSKKQQNSLSQNGMNANGPQQLSPQDLDRMLREIEELARSGARDHAAQMLGRLREMLENIQPGAPQNGNSGKQMMSLMENLNELISRQQKLLDETFRQKQESGEEEGQPNAKSGKKTGKLTKNQQSLQKMLNELMQGMRDQGMEPGQPLDQAGKAMGEAGESLGDNNLDRATQQQTLALDKLRKGAQGLTRQMLQQLGRQMGEPGSRDPFGRQTKPNGPDFGDNRVDVPDKVDVQRAREILQELRKRYSDTNRPPVELDYLERLLEKF